MAAVRLFLPALFFAAAAAVLLLWPSLSAAEVDAATPAVEAGERERWFSSEFITGELDVGDFIVSPGRVELEARPGETAVRYLTITNRVSDNRTFELLVEDVAGTEDGSAAVRLLGEERGPYTLKDYISFPSRTFTLALGERARIPVFINIPADASPGGFYGSVLVTTVRDEGADGPVGGDTGARSPIIARVGTLFFVTVPGEVERSGAARAFSLIDDYWWYESGPVRFGIAYENTGSVHLAPYGELRVRNMFGEEVGFVEIDPWFVLPGSLRFREITWDRELLLGRYTATLALNRGYDDIVDEFELSFWVLPWKMVGGTFLVFFIIFFALRAFFRTFELKRRGS
jgi:hypothetical protein